MPTIPSTRLNTPTTIGAALDLCQGFALYPNLGTARAGISAEDFNFTLISTMVKVGPYEAASADIRISCGFHAGICGPAYATDLTVHGTADASAIALDATASETYGGLEVGLGLTFNVVMDLAGWALPDQRVKFSTTLDIISIIIDYFLGKIGGSKNKKGDVSLPSGFSLSARDTSLGGLADTGRVALRPDFYLIINLVQFVPLLANIVVFLKKVGGSLDLGPTLNVVLPVSIAVDKFRTGGHEYTVTGGNKRFTGARTGSSQVGANDLEVVLTHQSSVQIGFGVGFELKVLKFFSIGAHSRPIDVMSLLNIHTTTSPHSNTLRAAYGATDTGPPRADSPDAGHEGHDYEVVFEDLEPAVS